MKAIFIIGILIIGSSYCLHSQQIVNELKLLADSAIHLKCLEIQKGNNRSKEYFDGLYLINEYGQSLVSSKKLQLKSIDVFSNQNKKKLKKGIHAWKVITILRGNQIIIDVVDFYITYKKNNYDFVNIGGSKAIFEFSCDKRKWELISYNSSGV